jgi:hypothetical protein
MTKQTQMYVGVGVVAIVGYFLWKSTQKKNFKGLLAPVFTTPGGGGGDCGQGSDTCCKASSCSGNSCKCCKGAIKPYTKSMGCKKGKPKGGGLLEGGLESY